VVITAGGGAGVLPLLATVVEGGELLLATGIPAEGFFATRGLGFFGFGVGAGAEGVSVVAAAGGGAVVASGAGGSGVGACIVGASACGAGTAGFFFLQPEVAKMSAASAIGSAIDRIRPLISSPFQPAR
jgi:hypothetical protein